jgi:hypothetical protein
LEHYPSTRTREAHEAVGGELLATWVAVLIGCVFSAALGFVFNASGSDR